MGLRESIGRHPYRTVSAVAVVVVASVIVFASQMKGEPRPTLVANAYFTIDDGTSFFVDNASNVAPFDHDGKEAVLAHVFSCPDGKRFVGYLERAISAKGRDEIANARRQLLEEGKRQVAPMPSSDVLERIRNNSEVKPPGGKTWVHATGSSAQPIYAVSCPDGSGGAPKEVLP